MISTGIFKSDRIWFIFYCNDTRQGALFSYEKRKWINVIYTADNMPNLDYLFIIHPVYI